MIVNLAQVTRILTATIAVAAAMMVGEVLLVDGGYSLVGLV